MLSASLLFLVMAVDVSAEFWGRTIPLKDDQGALQPVATDDHIVVEVRVAVKRGQPARVTASQFKLRLNGAKEALVPDSAGMAASAVKYSDWSQRRRLEVGAGPVIIGRPHPTPRFPGDPTGQPPANDPRPKRAEPTAEAPIHERLEAAAWPDGEVHGEKTGLLFFPWTGKVSKIKKLELEWTDGSGEARVKLR